MTDFEDRLAKANMRAKASSEDAAAARVLQQDQRGAGIERLKGIIRDWNGRIAPTIASAVSVANGAISDSRFLLTAQPDATHVIELGTSGPPVPSLPKMKISATERNPTVRGGAQARVGQPSSGRSQPSLEFTVTREGQIAFRVVESKMTVPTTRIEPADFTDDVIKSMIADFVDALIPGR
jgi:hypothetical protein